MPTGLQAGFVRVYLNVDNSTLHFKHYDRSPRILYVLTVFYPQKGGVSDVYATATSPLSIPRHWL
jgi:hypothetical protein